MASPDLSQHQNAVLTGAACRIERVADILRRLHRFAARFENDIADFDAELSRASGRVDADHEDATLLRPGPFRGGGKREAEIRCRRRRARSVCAGLLRRKGSNWNLAPP